MMDKYEISLDGEGGHEHPHADHRTFEDAAEAVYDYSKTHHRIGTLMTVVNTETAGIRYYVFTTGGLRRLTPSEAARQMVDDGWMLPTAEAA